MLKKHIKKHWKLHDFNGKMRAMDFVSFRFMENLP